MGAAAPPSVRPARLLLLGVILAAPAAMAARPFVTDDARIVDPGGCQIESYVKRQRNFGERETWFLPGCNPGGNLELTIGGTRAINSVEGKANALVVQGKTLLRPLHTNDYGIAATIGTLRHQTFTGDSATRWSPYINLISSLSRLNDGLVIHANAGVIEDRIAGLTRPTWGLGGEILLAPRWYGIVESYGQKSDKASQQIGLRFWAVPDRVQVDGTVGRQRSGPPARDWISLGVRLLF